jgi:hypothetical protein
MSTTLVQLINQSTSLSLRDKEFLVASVPTLDRLENLRLRQNLTAGNTPVMLQQLELIKQKYNQAQQQESRPDPISKIVERFIPKKEKLPVSISFFAKPYVLGSTAPQAVQSQVQVPSTLQEITDPAQLRYLNQGLIEQLSQSGSEQKLNEFLANLASMFQRIDDIGMRRNYFMTYMQSSLFTAYIGSGLTALKHEELKPRKISLNLLYQIDPKYLNTRQFKTAAVITNQLRTLCVI